MRTTIRDLVRSAIHETRTQYHAKRAIHHLELMARYTHDGLSSDDAHNAIDIVTQAARTSRAQCFAYSEHWILPPLRGFKAGWRRWRARRARNQATRAVARACALNPSMNADERRIMAMNGLPDGDQYTNTDWV